MSTDDTATTNVMTLPRAERQVLAALAVVGRASLSAEELAALVEVEDVAPVIADLQRRGLVQRDEEDRYSVLGRLGEEIRKTDSVLATGDRLLKYVTVLAKGGSLTPERLAEDAEAILGLSEWTAETEQWEELLELVKTLQACFGIAHRVHDWLALLERGRTAARVLGDNRSEVWVLQQMATAAASTGDAESAQEYLREADRLQRRRGGGRRTTEADDGAAGGRAATTLAGGGLPRAAYWLVGLLVAAGAGVGAGFALGGNDGNVGATTATVPLTMTVGGATFTTHDTITLPATTVLASTTVLTTTTETTTVTVTTTPAIK
jgi:hypothetical protein